jgi:hypothetical protein
MKTIRGGMGLGDAMYVQAVARHITQRVPDRLRIATAWPDVFRPLGERVECIPFTRLGVDILAHYSRRKGLPGTTQFEDVCAEAKLGKTAELKIDWAVTDWPLVARLKQHGKPIVLVQSARLPMGRTDGFGAELLPDCRAIQRAIDTLHGRVLLVQVGAGPVLYRFRGIDVDLVNETTVAQLLDVASACDGVLGYVSFILPVAESMNKPGLFVWSRNGLKSRVGYVRQITPQKVIHRKDLMRVVKDGFDDPVEAKADAFLR